MTAQATVHDLWLVLFGNRSFGDLARGGLVDVDMDRDEIERWLEKCVEIALAECHEAEQADALGALYHAHGPALADALEREAARWIGARAAADI